MRPALSEWVAFPMTILGIAVIPFVLLLTLVPTETVMSESFARSMVVAIGIVAATALFGWARRIRSHESTKLSKETLRSQNLTYLALVTATIAAMFAISWSYIPLVLVVCAEFLGAASIVIRHIGGKSRESFGPVNEPDEQ